MIGNFQVGVAIILEKNDKILVGKRSKDKDFGSDLWELPSGRLEPGEQPEQAIQREGKEELQIEITAREIIDAYGFKRDDKDLILLTYICDFEGLPQRSHEHSELQWVTPAEAQELFFYAPQKRTIDIYRHSK